MSKTTSISVQTEYSLPVSIIRASPRVCQNLLCVDEDD
jgi:hypothetical protein